MDTIKNRKTLDCAGLLQCRKITQVNISDEECAFIRPLPAKVVVGGSAKTENAFAPGNLLVHSLCDEEGKLLFMPDEQDAALSIDFTTVNTILEAVIDLNGLRKSDTGEDAATKN